MKESAETTSGAGSATSSARGAPGVPHADADPPVYILGSDRDERTRLQRQSGGMRENTLAVLGHVPIPPGARVLDLGCGPSGALEVLSETVGPSGRVTGVDMNPTYVDLARQLIRDKGLGNVSVWRGDARRTGLAPGSFDLVHTRLVLVNIPDPEAVVTEMVRLVRPGGWLVSVEAEPLVNFVYPPDPAWDRLTDVFDAASMSDGVDLRIGRRVPGLFRRAGLTEVGVEVTVKAVPAGGSGRTVHADLVRAMWPKVVARRIASQSELEDLDRRVRRHLADPDTVAVSALAVLTWGRRPAGT